ncbi:hypothetical protein PV04_09133 [Phialophora macrospora]|uniref:Clr5 domain-containing protein n=1 Tax=Phialophora macrospora TaxID=1851006 RepID=A0A0D2FBF2_9EURO|nr:hypothetical protein PV04_09133 [Phialophora macrospora]
MPFAAARPRVFQSPKYTPVPGFAPHLSPDDVVIRTPSFAGDSPSQVTHPRDRASPLSIAAAEAMALDRTRLFLQGRFDDLARTMSGAEKTTMSTWLYQFWVFAFTASKHWGKGLRDWSRYNLDFDAFEDSGHHRSPASPALLTSSPMYTESQEDVLPSPPKHCRWSIHVVEEDYEAISDEVENSDSTSGEPPLEERLQNALESNDFSNIPADRLPIATSHIAKAVKRSPDELFLESFSFAIMARNQPLLEQMLSNLKPGVEVKTVFPLHIATSYLDGASTCCNILDLLCSKLPRLSTFYINNYGHTVLDNLMLTILKGHSSSSLHAIDETLTQESRLAGIEVDLCGRWDADSPCFRALLQSGKTKVPLSWKHKFCHTSALAVCHCIESLSGCDLLDQFDISSGLFVRRCFGCGLSLKLTPIHVLVLTAFQLARCGCEGEDLFGMIAVLLCMIGSRMDIRTRAAVSIDLLLGIDNGTDCTHEDLTPFGLAERLPALIVDGWSANLRRGWQIFCHILRPPQSLTDQSAETQPIEDHSMLDFIQGAPVESMELSSGHHDGHTSTSQRGNFRRKCGRGCAAHWENSPYYDDDTDDLVSPFTTDNNIGHLWAAVQTELLTYRKIKEGDTWLSGYFDLDAVLTGLQTGTNISMPLLDKGMIKSYCQCGRTAPHWEHILREDIAEYYFSNLDVWERTSFIEEPARIG